jgi:hypothetical protein
LGDDEATLVRAAVRFEGRDLDPPRHLQSPHLHAARGDHLAAMVAACEALDIEPVLR